MGDIVEQLRSALGTVEVIAGADAGEAYTHDESLTAGPVVPQAVVFPTTTAEVAATVAWADDAGVAVVARGSGTGLSGAAQPVADGIVVAFDRMQTIVEIDVDNQIAVVQPGVTLAQLDEALLPFGLMYPVFPGESGASIGGNIGTNAGGMRAIRHGVTRTRILGLEVVLADGRILRCGGKYVKSSNGYDLCQLLIGSEGTLALTTEAVLRLEPRPTHGATVLVPYPDLGTLTRAVPTIVASGLAPVILEYLDALTLASVTDAAGIELGVAEDIRTTATAWLVVVLEGRRQDHLDDDVEALAELLSSTGALEVYVLPDAAGAALIAARERAFWVAKAAGADDLVDAVVPRSAIAGYLATVAALAERDGSLVLGCGHVGDGNVHLSVFQPDPARRAALVHAVLEAAVAAGGAVSGEHGIGTQKGHELATMDDPVKLELMRRIKSVFDPRGTLGPGRLFDPVPDIVPVGAGES